MMIVKENKCSKPFYFFAQEAQGMKKICIYISNVVNM
jgi:hypothetical protein